MPKPRQLPNLPPLLKLWFYHRMGIPRHPHLVRYPPKKLTPLVLLLAYPPHRLLVLLPCPPNQARMRMCFSGSSWMGIADPQLSVLGRIQKLLMSLLLPRL